MKTRKLTPRGIEIKKALIDKGMTQVQLAEALGTDPKYLNLIIHGERSGKQYLERINTLLGLEQERL
ncbi:MAG: helix-turn-helix domain-containing protein [Filifactoraceae bacterium]